MLQANASYYQASTRLSRWVEFSWLPPGSGGVNGKLTDFIGNVSAVHIIFSGRARLSPFHRGVPPLMPAHVRALPDESLSVLAAE